MKRRGNNPKSWKTRLSAGGANRTSLHCPWSRLHEPGDSLLMPSASRRPNGFELMPAPRMNSFRPWNSCLQPVPPRSYRYEQPPPPISYARRQFTRRERSPELLYDEKGRPIPLRGMFLNAKYSEAARPPIDEDQIRHTEEVITRMIQKSRRKNSFDPPMPNYALREQIRRAVYNQGVPERYRAQEPRYSNHDEPGPSRRHPHTSSHHRDSRYSKYSRGDRRSEYEENKEEEDDMADAEDVFFEPKKQSKKRRRKPVVEDSEDEEEEFERLCRQTKKKRRQPQIEEEDNSSDEEARVREKSIQLIASKTSKAKTPPIVNEERAPSHGSKSSKHSTPKQPSPVSGSYIKDPDDDDNWKNSIPFMCDPNGAGAAMLERVGSAITALPLRDDSTNSYSQVALMLLGKSLKNFKNSQKDVDEEKIQTRIMNMSTSWAPRNPVDDFYDPQEEFDLSPYNKKCDTSLMHEISKIQNPQNATTVQMDQSFFTNPRHIEEEPAGMEEDWMRVTKKQMPPPLFRSSPISNDIFRSSDGITMPSSIKKGPEEFGFCISDDEEDPSTKQFDIDDYIARGASQLDYSYFPADPDISFHVPTTNIFAQFKSPRSRLFVCPQISISTRSFGLMFGMLLISSVIAQGEIKFSEYMSRPETAKQGFEGWMIGVIIIFIGVQALISVPFFRMYINKDHYSYTKKKALLDYYNDRSGLVVDYLNKTILLSGFMSGINNGTTTLIYLGLVHIIIVQLRSVSSKYPRPTPRHFKRRLFEATLQPELPPTVNTCIPPGLIKREHTEKSKEYSDVELALANLVREWMVKEEFRVMAVCQIFPVSGRTLWFAKNQLRSKNIEFRSYGNKILNKVFEKTPMSSLDTVLVGSNAILLAKDINAIKTILQETDKLNWIEPLVLMADDRIVDMVEARKLVAKLSSMEDLRAHTVQILGQQVAQITISLDTATRHLPSLLDAYASSSQEKKD